MTGTPKPNLRRELGAQLDESRGCGMSAGEGRGVVRGAWDGSGVGPA